MKKIVIIDGKDLFPSELNARECKSYVGKEGGVSFGYVSCSDWQSHSCSRHQNLTIVRYVDPF